MEMLNLKSYIYGKRLSPEKNGSNNNKKEPFGPAEFQMHHDTWDFFPLSGF